MTLIVSALQGVDDDMAAMRTRTQFALAEQGIKNCICGLNVIY